MGQSPTPVTCLVPTQFGSTGDRTRDLGDRKAESGPGYVGVGSKHHYLQISLSLLLFDSLSTIDTRQGCKEYEQSPQCQQSDRVGGLLAASRGWCSRHRWIGRRRWIDGT